jgi:hypothetical protein
MKKVRISAADYYNRPEWYRFMPPIIFDLLEEAVLKSSKNNGEIFALVPEEQFNQMLKEKAEYDKHHT